MKSAGIPLGCQCHVVYMEIDVYDTFSFSFKLTNWEMERCISNSRSLDPQALHEMISLFDFTRRYNHLFFFTWQEE